MSKYRFKTKEEFIRDGLWDDEYDTPKGWNRDQEMNEYLGREIPVFYLEKCEAGVSFRLGGWMFCSHDYVEISDEGFKQIEESKKWSEWFPTKEINDNGFEYFGDTPMEVSSNNESWFTSVVFGKKGGYYLAWSDAETLKDAKNTHIPISWKYARPIKTKLTLKQVADKFGLKEDEIEII